MIFRSKLKSKVKSKAIVAASFATIEASENGTGKFSANPAYSGGVLKVGGYLHGIVVDLSGLTMHRKVIANLDHDPSKRVGVIVNANNDGRTLSLEGDLTAATPYRDEVVASHHEGFEWDVSIEIMPTKIEFLDEGKSATVNGQRFEGPVEIARKSSLHGLAFVGIGADSGNRVLIAASADSEMPDPTEGFEAWLTEQGFDIATLTEMQMKALEKMFKRENGDSEEEPGVMEASYHTPNIEAAFARADTSIEDICIKYESECVQHEGRYLAGLTPEKIEGIKLRAQKRLEGLKTRAINASYSRAQFKTESARITNNLHLELIRASRPVGPSIHSSNKDILMNPQIIQAGLHIASGREDVALKAFGEQVTEAARRKGPRSYQEAAEQTIRASGLEVPRDRFEMFRLACRPILASGYSTLSLPTMLANTMGRSLEQAYLENTDSWRPFVTVKSAANFKPQTSVRPSSAGNLEQVGATGELKHQVIGEEGTLPWQVGTWGIMETISRQDIINDDLSYLNERPTMNGIAAARTINDLIWSTIMSYAFANSITLALTIDNLVSAVAKMKTQKDSKGNSIDMAPVALAVPPELEGAARQILRSTEVLNVTAGGLVGNANPAYGIVPNLVVEPRLSNSKFTDSAIDNWYLFGGPMTSAVIVGFLEGQQTPKVETSEADFNTLGMSLRCYHDFGVAMGDGKASLKSNPA